MRMPAFDPFKSLSYTHFGFPLPRLTQPGWRWRMGRSVFLLCSYLGVGESREHQ